MWFDLLDESIAVVAGAVCAGAGYFYGLSRGFAFGRDSEKLRKKAEGLEPKKPLCLCKHYPSYHENGGPCRRTWVEQRYDARLGNHDVEVTCRCQKYIGPEPLPEFYAPEVQ